MITRRRVLGTLASLAAGAFALGNYAFAIEPGWRFVTTRYRIRPKGWPDGFKLRIACISDIHCSEPQMGLARVGDVVKAANAEQPDVTVLLGDYGIGQKVYARPVPPAELARPLKDLKARLGVYGILGNHDYWGGSLRAWPYTREKVDDFARPYRQMLADAGATLLENDVRRLDAGSHAFWLVGTGSSIAVPLGRQRFISYADLAGQLPKLTDEAPAILLAHEPDLFPQVPDRIALTLSGHTHGGQVRLFGYSPITPSRYGNRYAYGHIVENDRNLVVSGGLGTSVLPVRFGVPPELVVIDLG
jgi:predicted MPP superfamily phosphohydrolase